MFWFRLSRPQKVTTKQSNLYGFGISTYISPQFCCIYCGVYWFIPPGEVDGATSMSLVYHCPLLSHLLVPRCTMILLKFYPDWSSKDWGSPTVKSPASKSSCSLRPSAKSRSLKLLCFKAACPGPPMAAASEASWDLMSSLKMIQKPWKH